MNIRKRNGMVVIMFMAVVCMIYGCTASPSSDYGSANVENEKYMEKTGVELFESREEPESMPTIEPLGSESGEELLSSLMAETLELENSEEVEYPSEEEIEELGIPEDMLAYWLVLNNKKPFISVNQEGQKFFWNEYFWYIRWVCDEYNAYQFMIVDVDRDGSHELVFTCSDEVAWILHCDKGEVFGYHLRTSLFEPPVITVDGVFHTDEDEISPTGYARITAFEEDGYRIEPVEDYQKGSHDRVRYYFFSEEAMAQWLE